MSVTVSMSDLLKNATGQREPVQFGGGTSLQCVEQMISQFPILNKWLYDETGNLRAHVWLLVNDELIYEDEFYNPLNDGDKLSIMIAVLGG